MKLFIALTLLIAAFNVSANEVSTYKVVCSSKGYAGDSVTTAIKACVEVGHQDERNCSRSISCNPYRTFCTTKGYAGDNVADSVKRCRELGNQSQRNCLRSVSCR